MILSFQNWQLKIQTVVSISMFQFIYTLTLEGYDEDVIPKKRAKH